MYVDVLTCPRRPEEDVDQAFIWLAVNISFHSESITLQRMGFCVSDRVFTDDHTNKVLYYMRKRRPRESSDL